MKIKQRSKFHRKKESRPAKRGRKVEPTGFVREANRNAKGQVGPGNSLARKADGINRFKKTGELPEAIRVAVEAFGKEVESDQGGPSEMTAIRGGYVRRLRDVEAVLQLLAADLRERGMFTERGRTRSTLQTFLQTLDRWDRFAQRLGLERRAKQVPSIEDFIREKENAK